MKIEIHKCDICNEERKIKQKTMTVIFLTEQDEGRSVDPYLENVSIELCNDCEKKILEGNILYATGAMGYNNYRFNK